MKLAIIGYGVMGQLVAKLALEQGHEVAVTFNSRDGERSAEELAISLRGCDVAIDFSVAAAVIRNGKAYASADLPLVEGPTGWERPLAGAKKAVSQNANA